MHELMCYQINMINALPELCALVEAGQQPYWQSRREEMASIALMHVTPNGVKCPSGTVKPELRWFFEGNLGKLLGNTKNATKVNFVVCV